MAESPPSTTDHDSIRPLVSSQALGWKNLFVEEYKTPPGGIAYQAWPDHAIAVCLSSKPNRLQQMIGDRRYTGLYRKGDISITPAELPSSYQSFGDDHYLHMQVSPALVRQVATEAMAMDGDRLEIVPEFRTRNPQIEQLAMMLRAELRQGGTLGQLYVDSLTNALVVHVLRDYATTQPCIEPIEGGLGERRLLQVSEYIQSHLDQDIKLADLAQLLGISHFHFSRLFKQSTGVPPHQYLLQQRIERAKQLLKQTDLSVVEIALACGFNSHSHLSSQFRQLTGLTPRDFRAG